PVIISPHIYHTHTHPPHISTLSLHDALPISQQTGDRINPRRVDVARPEQMQAPAEVVGDRGNQRLRQLPLDARLTGEDLGRDQVDRKSTRLNSSHQIISYAVFCLKKKTINDT